MVCPGFVNTNITLNALKENGKKLNKIERSHIEGISPNDCAKDVIRGIIKNEKVI